MQEGEPPIAMMGDLQKKYNRVLDTLSYRSIDALIQAREPKIRSAEDFIENKGI
jgi:hypothetical protein